MTSIAQVPTNGLVAHYPFTGNANDNSANANNGTVTGATLTTDRFGNVNAAYSFSNTSDKIALSTVSANNILKYSVAGWFQKTTASNGVGGTIFGQSNGCVGADGLRLWIGNNNLLTWAVEYSSGCQSKSKHQPTYNYSDNQWHFFVVTFDGASGAVKTNQLKIYVDNILVTQLDDSSSNTSAVTVPLINSNFTTTIGNVNNSVDGFKGKLDDFRIYDRVLNSSEVTALYNEGICLQSLNVTDTLTINMTITSYNPITFSNNIKIYPNPTNDQLNISIANGNNNGYQIKIINSLSQTMWQQTITGSSYSVNLNGFASGTYFVNVSDVDGNLVEVKKIILQ